MRVRKIAKATISFVMSASPSVRMEQLGFPLTHFQKIIFRKSVKKSQVSLLSDKNDGHFA